MRHHYSNEVNIVKRSKIGRVEVLRNVAAFCIYNNVDVELGPEYETLLNELRTVRLKPGVAGNNTNLEALLADFPDPLPIVNPNIYKKEFTPHYTFEDYWWL